MKAFIASVAAVIILGVAAALVLALAQRPAYTVYSTTSTRVGEPGDNLVGGNWTGNPGKDPVREPHGNKS